MQGRRKQTNRNGEITCRLKEDWMTKLAGLKKTIRGIKIAEDICKGTRNQERK